MTSPNAGCLMVVGTPIGNLEDLSARAIRALAEADLIYCEDTRRTRGLLSALKIAAPRLVRLDQHNEVAMGESVVEQVAAGQRAVVVTDAGMPTISDPGHRVVKAVADAGLPVAVVPGPCAVSAALALSGLPASEYRFAGFLPRKGRDRTVALDAIRAATVTTVIYEAPSRVARTVSDLAEACGPIRRISMAREITKMHEEVWRGDLGGAVDWLSGSDDPPRGEFVQVVGGAEEAAPGDEVDNTDEAILAALRSKVGVAGRDRRQAVAEVAAETGAPKRRVYDLALQLKGEHPG
jgi:16S rRNA (cytidine1402-2'-O)-methyltransferase